MKEEENRIEGQSSALVNCTTTALTMSTIGLHFCKDQSLTILDESNRIYLFKATEGRQHGQDSCQRDQHHLPGHTEVNTSRTQNSL